MNSDNYPENPVEDVLPQLKEIVESVMYAAEAGSEEQVLERIAQVSRELVNARYAALGVPDGKGGLRYFKVSGMTQEEILQVAHLPIGLGLLGAIMKDREVLRLERFQEDPRSVGFPTGHPPMYNLLGVPIQVGTQLLGMLYLTDREDGLPFSERDQWLIETMAGYAALAIVGAQLSEQQGRLRMLEERERIAMDLHDGIIQSLYAIGMHLDLMRAGNRMCQDDLGNIISNLNTVIEDIRRYILNLKSVNSGTIYDYFREMLNRLYIPEGLKIEINAPHEPPPFTTVTFEAICQIANEAISNAVRHAKASHIGISTQHAQGRFQITITDDGAGFDPAATVSAQNGLGLRNMERRAKMFGGQVTIKSLPGQGTTLTITLPVNVY
jgi:signal transduction histidine kinase